MQNDAIQIIDLMKIFLKGKESFQDSQTRVMLHILLDLIETPKQEEFSKWIIYLRDETNLSCVKDLVEKIFVKNSIEEIIEKKDQMIEKVIEKKDQVIEKKNQQIEKKDKELLLLKSKEQIMKKHIELEKKNLEILKSKEDLLDIYQKYTLNLNGKELEDANQKISILNVEIDNLKKKLILFSDSSNKIILAKDLDENIDNIESFQKCKVIDKEQ